MMQNATHVIDLTVDLRSPKEDVGGSEIPVILLPWPNCTIYQYNSIMCNSSLIRTKNNMLSNRDPKLVATACAHSLCNSFSQIECDS